MKIKKAHPRNLELIMQKLARKEAEKTRQQLRNMGREAKNFVLALSRPTREIAE